MCYVLWALLTIGIVTHITPKEDCCLLRPLSIRGRIHRAVGLDIMLLISLFSMCSCKSVILGTELLLYFSGKGQCHSPLSCIAQSEDNLGTIPGDSFSIIITEESWKQNSWTVEKKGCFICTIPEEKLSVYFCCLSFCQVCIGKYKE
jgi:hypothetical protein